MTAVPGGAHRQDRRGAADRRHAEFVELQAQATTEAPTLARRQHGRARSRWLRGTAQIALAGALAITGLVAVTDVGSLRSDLVGWFDAGAEGR